MAAPAVVDLQLHQLPALEVAQSSVAVVVVLEVVEQPPQQLLQQQRVETVEYSQPAEVDLLEQTEG